MVHAEFLRFIESLDRAAVSDDERRLLNILVDHFDSIAPLGTAAGRRSKFIVGVAYPRFDELSTDTPSATPNAPSGLKKLSRLNALSVGPFRGFAREELFDLDNQVILLYGPNGTGKSSFCEALELALLGTVNDSSTKRIEPDEYLKNARTGTFVSPSLTALFENDELDTISANDDTFRFCFVEKNRIDEFSRIASFTPGQQERLIASLFGIQEFDSFISNFNENIESYLPDDSTASGELQELETSLIGHRQIADTKDATIEQLSQSEKALADSYRDGMPYADFVLEIGDTESGAIKKLMDELGEQQRAKIGASKSLLDDAIAGVYSSQDTLALLQERRLARSTEISYRDLYRSVLALESGNPENCPACDTPLFGAESARSNPYNKARNALEGLTELAQIERQIEEAHQQLEDRASGLLTQLNNIESNLDEEERRSAFAADLRSTIAAEQTRPRTNWWQGFFGSNRNTVSEPREHLYRCVERMEQQDEHTSNHERRKESSRRKLAELTSLREKIVERTTQRFDAEQRIQNAEVALQNADSALAEARQKVADEDLANAVRQRIVRAYSSLLSRLQQYRDNLPATLLANLGQSVVTLYNAINRGDFIGDLMADIRLPLKPGDRIMFSYASAPEEYFDALHVLSEGHIRCLGLAILLAKNLGTKCPLLIFDDPVNAIDEDHREGIRRTLFEDSYFAEKQIILTCHGEEFTKDIQNLIGAANANSKCKSYTFLPHTGDNNIRIEVSATKNYIVLARTKFERNELRESLANARRGLEWAANTIWTKIMPLAGIRAVSVQLPKPGSKPELMNLVQSLLREIRKNTFMNPQKAQLDAGLSAIAGVNQSSREWEYLNKGTHEEEDRGEFDQSVVRNIVEALEKLDAAIEASRHPATQTT